MVSKQSLYEQKSCTYLRPSLYGWEQWELQRLAKAPLWWTEPAPQSCSHLFDLFTIHIVKGGARNPVYYMKVKQMLQKGNINCCDCDEDLWNISDFLSSHPGWSTSYSVYNVSGPNSSYTFLTGLRLYSGSENRDQSLLSAQPCTKSMNYDYELNLQL